MIDSDDGRVQNYEGMVEEFYGYNDVSSVIGSCEGCAFAVARWRENDVPEAGYVAAMSALCKLAACVPSTRKDNRNVIFVRKEPNSD